MKTISFCLGGVSGSLALMPRKAAAHGIEQLAMKIEGSQGCKNTSGGGEVGGE